MSRRRPRNGSSALGPVFVGALLPILNACVGESRKLQEADERRLAPFILDRAPERVPHAVGTTYDNKVTLLGYGIEPDGPVEPKARIKLTMYWRSDQKLEPDWKLFTHVLDDHGQRLLNLDNVGPLRQWKETRQALAPSVWKPGKVYVDEQSFVLPEKLATRELRVTTGIWRKDQRLVIVSGPNAGENRGLVATLQVKSARPAPSKAVTPRLTVPRLSGAQKIAIDGKLDDAAWSGAADTGPFVDVSTGLPNQSFPVNGSVLLLWDDAGAYFGFRVSDPDLHAGFDEKQRDPKLWLRDTVEIMIDPDGDGDNQDYYEIQINPQNLVFDSQFDRYNEPKTEPNGPYGHQDWSSGIRSAVSLDGTLEDSDDRDQGYTVEALLPWKALTKAKTAPPRPGDTWRLNFYAMQDNGGVAWSPILRQGNFHRARRFGYVVWAEGAGVGGSDARPAPSTAPKGTPGKNTPNAVEH